jgi:ABC-2 type transport system permease protein
MRVWLRLLNTTFQEAMEYRVEGVIWFLYDVLPPIVMVFLWLAAYREQSVVAGYTLPEMLFYYLGTMVLRTLVTVHSEWEIAWEVRQGTLSNYLVKPLNPWVYWLADQLAWKAVRLLFLTPVVAGTVLWLLGELAPPRLGVEHAVALPLALVLAFLLCYGIKLALGMTAFWITDIGGVMGLYEVLAYLFSGTILPLDLLPPVLQQIAALLPLQYIYYFPLSVALGRVSSVDLWQGLLAQTLWTAGSLALARVVWQRALVRYEAVGG